MRVRIRYIGVVALIVAIAVGVALYTGADRDDPTLQPLDDVDIYADEVDEPGIDISTLEKLPSDPAPPQEVVSAEEQTAEDEAAEESEAYQTYLQETASAVTQHAGAIVALGEMMLDVYMQQDAETLLSAFPADEGVTADVAQALIDRYPEVVSGELAGNVNVFAVGEATLYVYYLNVVWEDGGVTSSHTIEIPMRFIDGAWYVSSVTLGSGDSRFIQSVTLSGE